MILVSANPNIGDAVLSLPAVKCAADSGPVYFWSNCPQLGELYSHHNLLRLDDAPIGENPAKVLAIREVRNMHPAVMVLGQYFDIPIEGLTSTAAVAEPWLIADPTRDVPSYDFLLAPHTKDTSNKRCWNFAGWSQLIIKLKETYPGCTIGITGASSDPQVFDQYNVQYQYGRHWQDVMALMTCTKHAVITIDSAVSRVAHGLGISNHVLLCSDVVPEVWGTWPGAHSLYGSPHNFTVEDILGLIRSIHA